MNRPFDAASFKSLLEHSLEVIALVDKIGTVLWVSPSVTRVIGYTVEEYVGHNVFEFMHPDDVPHLQEKLGTILKRNPGEIVTAQTRVRHKDGTWKWIEGSGNNLLSDPDIHAIVLNYRDITVHKHIEDELEHRLKELNIWSEQMEKDKAKDEAILNSVGVGLIVSNDQNIVSVINTPGESLLGWNREEALGKQWHEVLHICTDNETCEPLKDLPPENTTLRNSICKKKDGNTFPALITISPVKLHDKKIGSVCIFRDTTFETATDKAKSQFISLAAHELRTPLTLIKWSIEGLQNFGDVNVSDEYKENVDTVKRATQRMIDLANDLLQVSRIELGNITPNVSPIHLKLLIEEVLLEFRPIVQTKSIQLQTQIDADIPECTSDSRFIRIILQNILSNATKYTPDKGTIQLHVKKNTDTITITLTDTGYGIPEAIKDQIFTKLFRADNVKAHLQDGTGLGLYITRSLIESLGGTITFTSAGENKGTTFTLQLPINFKKV